MVDERGAEKNFEKALSFLQLPGREGSLSGATARKMLLSNDAQNESRNPLKTAALCAPVQSRTTKGDNRPGKTRTCDTRIMSPLL